MDRVTIKRACPAVAKITRPVGARLAPRRRLFDALNQARDRAAGIWVSAPGGGGKTSLIAGYVEALGLRSLWYQIDVRDADPAVFFHLLALAARQATPRSRKPLPVLTAEYMPGLAAYTRTFFEALFRRLPDGAVVVLDNIEDMPAPAFAQLMRDAIPVVPRGYCIIMVGRGEPPPGLTRLVVNGAIECLGWEALRFTSEESCAVAELRGFIGDGRLTCEAVRELNERVQGWIAGLVLLLEQPRTRGPSADPRRGSEMARVFDYLAAEVFDQVGTVTRDFLLQTALLGRVRPRTAQRLTKNRRAGLILEGLRRRQLFISVHEADGVVYQYHALFREFLLARATRNFSPTQLAGLRREAAHLLLADGEIEEAAELLRAAEAWHELAALIQRHAADLLAHGRFITLGEWLEYLPAVEREDRPWLLYWEGMARFGREPLSARGRFERAFDLFEGRADRAALALAWCGIVDSYFLSQDDYTPLGRWLRSFETLFGEQPHFSEPELDARVTSSLFNLLVNHQPQHPALPAWQARLSRLLAYVPNDAQRLFMGAPLLVYLIWKGEVAAAGAVVHSLRPATRGAATHPTRIFWHAVRALHFWTSGDFPAAFDAVEESLRLARATEVHSWDCMALAQGSYAALSGCELEKAARYLSLMEAAVDARRRQDVAQYHFLRTWEALLQGETGSALHHAETALGTVEMLGIPFPIASTRLGSAQVLVDLGRYEEAEKQIDLAAAIAEAMGSRLLDYNACLSRTLLAFARGELAAGEHWLGKTMALARGMGQRNHVLWRPEVMADLCARALSAGIEVEYVQGLVRARGLAPTRAPLDIEEWPWRFRVYTLGRFELVRDGAPLRFSGKAQKRPLDLLRSLLALGGRQISTDRLAAALWPDADGDAAQRAFAITLHRLRKLLADDRVLQLSDGRLTLDPGRCWVDVWAFGRLLGEAETALARGDADPAWHTTERAMALYQGPFLGRDAARSWVLPTRERLKSRYLSHLRLLLRSSCAAKQCERAFSIQQKALEVDPVAEEFYRGLMECYRCQGRNAEGQAVYRRCREALWTLLGAEPSAETVALMRTLWKGG